MDLGSEVFDLCMKPLEAAALDRRRRELIPQAAGTVLELGAGTGVNLPYYDFSRVAQLHLSDPDLREKLLRRAVRQLGHQHAPRRVHAHQAGAESIPFPDHTFDSVVFTLVFCTVANPLAGLREVRRVLKPAGKIYFIEHVISENPALGRGMHFLNRPWNHLSGGCNINRDTTSAIREAGFEIGDFRRLAKGLVISGVGYLPA